MNCCKVHIPLFFVFKMENPRGRWTYSSFSPEIFFQMCLSILCLEEWIRQICGLRGRNSRFPVMYTLNEKLFFVKENIQKWEL